MRMLRIAMEPAGVVVAHVRGMSLARNVEPAAPAVNFMTQFASGRGEARRLTELLRLARARGFVPGKA